MDRKAFLALKEEHWVELFAGKGLKVCLVPSEMPDMTTSKLLGGMSKSQARDICTNAFVNWEGYEEDGELVPNTLDNRIEFYGFPVCRAAINARLEELNVKPLEGEENAATD